MSEIAGICKEYNITQGLYKNEHLNIKTPNTLLKGTKAIDRFESKEYRINHRYEGSGDSELRSTAFRVEWTGSDYETWVLYDWRRKDDCQKIADVDKDDIGKDLTKWIDFCGNFTPYEDNHVFFNLFERDWWAGLKDLGEIYYPQSDLTLYMYGCMTGDNDWYINDPGSYAWNDEVDLAVIESSWAEWHTSSKGHFRIWRVD